LKIKQYEICLNVLEMSLEYPVLSNKLDSLKFLMKAQCHEANENKLYAISCYFECLKKDPTCIEAFNRLIDCYLLTNPESTNLSIYYTESLEFFHEYILIFLRGTIDDFIEF
jgi:antitoxin component HigA of HigAB toxin-antitoxin module